MNHEILIPVPLGHDQEMWFAKLEANGIWERVFQFVTNPSDVTSAYFACDLFRNHLQEKRKMMLLPGVFGVLQRHTKLLELNVDDQVAGDEVADKHTKVFLKLRLVSKFWKKTLDEQFFVLPLELCQTDWYFKFLRPKRLDPVKSRRTYLECAFLNIDDVDNVMEALQSRESCSSLLRAIFVDDSKCTDKASFYSKLVQFLGVHGESVWGFGFFQRLADFKYEELCSLVSRMPHLKALYLSCYRDYSVPLNLEANTARFQRVIAQNPFPSLPSLELCDFNGFPPPGELLMAEILNRNVGLKAVHLGCWNYEHAVTPDLVWNALGSLRLEAVSLTYEAVLLTPNRFRSEIRKLLRFDWPLKALHVSYDFEIDVAVPLGMDAIFEVLNRFSHSIVEVSLRSKAQYRTRPYNNQAIRVAVDFPNLKNFDIDVLNDLT